MLVTATASTTTDLARDRVDPVLASIPLTPAPSHRNAGDQEGKMMTEACVGIVWGITDGRKPLRLVTHITPLSQAELYGDCLGHPAGHHDVWEDWRRLGPVRLAYEGLPTKIAWHEYEHFPRGRVVFDTGAHRFTFYADRRLQAAAVVNTILARIIHHGVTGMVQAADTM